MEPLQMIHDRDPFGGMADFDLTAEARLQALEFNWPPSAHRAVGDYKALAEEVFTVCMLLEQMTNGNFKKVKKDDLLTLIGNVRAEVNGVLAYRPVLKESQVA